MQGTLSSACRVTQSTFCDRVRPTLRRRGMLPVFFMVALLLPVTSHAQRMDWTRQFGTGFTEVAYGAAAFGNKVFVTGQIDNGTLPGATSFGRSDGFVRAYAGDGNERWSRHFGTTGLDRGLAIAADASGVYAVGSTLGQLEGETRVGGFDVIVAHFDADGQRVWGRQFGTALDEESAAIAVHDGAIYVSGWLGGAFAGETSSGHFDAFVCRLDGNGDVVWARQFGSAAIDRAYGIAVDASGVYVVGEAARSMAGEEWLGGTDAFLARYDLDGNMQWLKQFGTAANDKGLDVALHRSGVYVVGTSLGVLPGQNPAGGSDAFVRRYDVAGNDAWTFQFGSVGDDEASGIVVDDTGVYASGVVEMALEDHTSAGGNDAFVCKLNFGGAEVWSDQFGSPADERGASMAVGVSGIYVAGVTGGELPGETVLGRDDAFVRRYLRFDQQDTRPFDVPLAGQVTLNAAAPNPFNPTTRISFDLPRQARVSLKIFDATGRLVAEPINDVRAAGPHSFLWDAHGLASGVYYYRLEGDGARQTRKMVLLK